MPTAPIDVDTDTYLSAGALFLEVNDTVCDVVAAAATTAAGGGGMAGNDSGGVDWSTSYDTAAASALSTGATLVDSLGHVGTLLAASADNHASAEASSASGGPAYPGGDGGRGAVSVVPATPPPADGTAGDPPAGWFLIAHLLEYTWPNGHQAQLRAVASGWTTAATDLDAAADRLTRAIGDISTLRSPEIDAAVATCCSVQQSVRDLSSAYATLGVACAEYAGRLDEAHSDVLRELAEMAAETALIQFVSAALAVPSAGSGEVAGQAAQAARIAATATRVGQILGKLAEFVRLVTASIRLVGARIAEVLTRLRAVLGKGATRAIETVAPKLRPDWPRLSAMLRQAAVGKGNFTVGSATRSQIDAVGRAWVGPGATLSANGRAWTSADGLRMYRPPSLKVGTGQVRANLQSRLVPRGEWQTNAHIDVVD